jgi:threonylcarbamoyladenosine tRNA methylthiotransferase MtaB
MLHILSDKKRRYFYEQHLGETRRVLFEAHRNPALMSGFTDNYIKIELPHDPGLINEMREVTLRSINAAGVVEVDSITSHTGTADLV